MSVYENSHYSGRNGVSVDIRLISKFENGTCILIEDDLILQETKDNYQLNSFIGIKLFLIDIFNHTKQEILPEVRKYNIIGIHNVNCNKDYIYFATANKVDEDIVSISFVQYKISEACETVLLTFQENLHDLETTKRIKVFVLDENYIYVQSETYIKLKKNKLFDKIESANYNTYNAALEIDNFLYSVEDNHKIEINDETIKKFGIERILPIDGNICAIKVGYSILHENTEEFKDSEDSVIPTEIIGIINIKQFISDLVLQKEQVFIECLDQSAPNRTFPFFRYYEGNIIYSRLDINSYKEEIVLYDYSTKSAKIRVNNDSSRKTNAKKTFIINDAPYLIIDKKDSSHLINLNTQKTEWKLSGDQVIKYIKNDIIITEKHIKKTIFSKENYYIIAYKYPETHKAIFKEKGKFVGCLYTESDEMLIFSS